MFRRTAGWPLWAIVGLAALAGPVAHAGSPATPQPSPVPDQPPLRLKSLAATCAACHGTDGRAVADPAIPGLAGRPADELLALLNAFKTGVRPGTVMPQLAKGYDDGQIIDLASYFAAQRPTRSHGAGNTHRPASPRPAASATGAASSTGDTSDTGSSGAPGRRGDQP